MLYSTHTHIFTWVVALILFFVALSLFKNGMAKQMKIVHMVLRLFYVLILITGIILFVNFGSIDHMMYGLKFATGLAVIGFSEMVLVKLNKGKSAKGVTIGLIISFIITLYLGFSLPIGFSFLA
ncbi:YisL family protein [Salipaludibacillus daqingensis]|uniref:YisL family protein n=1 Tax=Salipaludibacillus daqingensis TaxID=3041001 RepID=UPI002473DE5C|nr:YisL family protein [Salipaludibacillus daqingensis]